MTYYEQIKAEVVKCCPEIITLETYLQEPRIELHHLLRTMHALDKKYAVDTQGEFRKWGDIPTNIFYNLSLPVALQSEETLKFLAELLSGNNK